ncbi:MAG: pyrroloquinoline quinone biosynthesis peptide chaperone PqqD [Candidatus Hydrogenedentota bacterium]|nr:MAG: pyrroloquinoline quinone biosynthesis peptide chaperone PqqD [Candidatus Hydrogenedentota bacterium]
MTHPGGIRKVNDTFNINRPQLVSFARYRWDKIRDQHQVVYPEGVLVLNETGARIVKLLDGRSTDSLIEELSRLFDGADVGPDVLSYLEGLYNHGLLTDDHA